MRCEEFDELLSLHFFDELDPARRIDFERHVIGCATCASLLESQRRVDELLRSTLATTPVSAAAAVQARVRERIESGPRWLRIFELRALLPVLASAALAIAILILIRPGIDSRAYLLETAAADHVEDIALRVEKPGWVVGERAVEPMAVRWVGDSRSLGAFAAEGYTLVKAKPCPLEGKSETWLHLIYSRGGRDVSLFVRNRKITTASRGQLTLASDPSCSRVGDLEVVGLERGDFGIVLVADLSRDEARRLASAAADWISSSSV